VVFCSSTAGTSPLYRTVIAQDLMPGLIRRLRDDVHVGEIGVVSCEVLRDVRRRGRSSSLELVNWLVR